MSIFDHAPPTRRGILTGALSLAGLAVPARAVATTTPAEVALSRMSGGLTTKDLIQIDQSAKPTTAGLPDTRGLWLENPHTGETATVLFWVSGLYDNHGYTQICRIMRDWRQNAVAYMDPKLLHLLWAIQRGSGFTRPLVINSAYRTVATNHLLRAEGAAINSLHLKRQACDLKLDGIPPGKVSEYVHSMLVGGVGFYPTFTHVDTGRIRTWNKR